MGTADSKPKKTTKGRGRPRLQEGQDTVPVTIRLTGEQKDKLARLGGSPWVRKRIGKAKDPAA